MLRTNHYDVALEAWLRSHRIPYVAVDETRRALLGNASLKSMDFVVYGRGGVNLLVDVKGRKWGEQGRRWENWTTQDDLESLAAWEGVFGPHFRGAFVFAYDLTGEETPNGIGSERPFEFQNRRYVFTGVWAREYEAATRRRSARWDTVWVPSTDFGKLRFSLAEWLGVTPADSLATEGAG